MKDEEMAEEWVKDNCCDLCVCQDECEIGCIHCGAKDGYLAGLKAGRPQWHDLREDPKDLPERISLLSKTVINQIGTPCHYNYALEYWQNWSNTEIETPIAWCEIPTFDKE